jgi:hypothetical protein
MFGLNWNLYVRWSAFALFSVDMFLFRLGLVFKEVLVCESLGLIADDPVILEGLGLEMLKKLDVVGVVIRLILSLSSPCFSASMHTLDDGLNDRFS